MKSRAATVAALIVALLVAPLAQAAPAVVKVFKASARQAPRPDAAVAGTFWEKDELSVSEEVTEGWRQVLKS